MRHRITTVIALASTLIATIASAKEPLAVATGERADEKPASKREHRFAITMSPLKAALGFAEVATEAKASRRVGVAGSFGLGEIAGSVTNEGEAIQRRVELLMWRLSPRWYAFGHFDHGVQVGADFSFTFGWASVRYGLVPLINFGVATFVGYKYVAPFGLTVELQAGLGTSTNIAGYRGLEVRSSPSVFPLGDFYVHAHTGVGWSF